MKLVKTLVFLMMFLFVCTTASASTEFTDYWERSTGSTTSYLASGSYEYYPKPGCTLTTASAGVKVGSSVRVEVLNNGTWTEAGTATSTESNVSIEGAEAVKFRVGGTTTYSIRANYKYVLADSADVTMINNNALSAKTSAENALTAANNAKTSADTAAARAQTAINNTTYNSQSAAYWAYLASQLTPTPTITKVQGQNGATCTSGNTFTLVISAAPITNVQHRVTCGAFDSGWTTSNTITISSISNGANTAMVQVKNASGSTSQSSITFFKV